MSKKNIKDLPVATISAARYTKEDWIKCYQDTDNTVWESATKPYSISEFVDQTYELAGLEDVDLPCRVVVIDEEYFAWLGDKENTSQNRLKYITTRSDKDALRLLKKNNLDLETSYLFLPFLVMAKEGRMPERASYKLNSTDVKQLAKKIGKKLSAEATLSPVLIEAKDLTSLNEDGIDTLDILFDEIEKSIQYQLPERFLSQRFDKYKTFAVLLSPIVVKAKVDTAIIDFNTRNTKLLNALYPEDIDFDIDFPIDSLDEDVAICALPPLCHYNEIKDVVRGITSSNVKNMPTWGCHTCLRERNINE